MFRWVNGRDPRQYGLDFGLWTRAVVVELIEEQLAKLQQMPRLVRSLFRAPSVAYIADS
jgi:hypothetical protein